METLNILVVFAFWFQMISELRLCLQWQHHCSRFRSLPRPLLLTTLCPERWALSWAFDNSGEVRLRLRSPLSREEEIGHLGSRADMGTWCPWCAHVYLNDVCQTLWNSLKTMQKCVYLFQLLIWLKDFWISALQNCGFRCVHSEFHGHLRHVPTGGWSLETRIVPGGSWPQPLPAHLWLYHYELLATTSVLCHPPSYTTV